MTEILTAEETARFLKLPLSTIYTYAKKGKIPAIKLGKSWRFDKKTLENWLIKQIKGGEGNNE